MKLFLSLPGDAGFKIYVPSDDGVIQLSFAAFDGYALNMSLSETDDESFEPFYRPPSEIPNSPGQDEYEFLVGKAIRTIRKNELGKIVTSRAQTIDVKIDPVPAFKKLVAQYPKACVYLFTHPESGTWMGATPETLVLRKNDEVLSMSLAGTKKLGEEKAFTSKEVDEQQMVTDFIFQQFQSVNGLVSIQKTEPEIVKAGNVLHLQTMIKARVEGDFDKLDLIKKLHPTPAVAGLPRSQALHFIHNNEGYSRGFYTGYFGLSVNNDFHYFVNLRCMQVFENSFVVYAGGGITRDSDPSSEWEETQNKMATLLSVINP